MAIELVRLVKESPECYWRGFHDASTIYHVMHEQGNIWAGRLREGITEERAEQIKPGKNGPFLLLKERLKKTNSTSMVIL